MSVAKLLVFHSSGVAADGRASTYGVGINVTALMLIDFS